MRPLIILADDDAIIRTLVELRLSMCGYEVRSFADGYETIDALRVASPSLIILDLQMPRMGGLGVLNWLKKDRRLQTVPTMVLTASAEADDVREAGRLGANGYVLKPFKPDILAARVEKLVRGAGAVWGSSIVGATAGPAIGSSVVEL